MLEFAAPEPEPIRRLDGGLLRPEPVASPVVGNTLGARSVAVRRRRPDLRRRRAVPSVTRPRGRQRSRFHGRGFATSASGRATVAISSASSLGSAPPVRSDFDGEFRDKPGLMLIAPGERGRCRCGSGCADGRPEDHVVSSLIALDFLPLLLHVLEATFRSTTFLRKQQLAQSH